MMKLGVSIFLVFYLFAFFSGLDGTVWFVSALLTIFLVYIIKYVTRTKNQNEYRGVVKESNDSLYTESDNKGVSCILDLETTGFEPEDSEIVEIFILKIQDGGIVDEFYSLFKPNNRIMNSNIHGITDNKVKYAPKLKDKNDEIFEFVGDSTLVGHNLDNFDLKFLNYHLNSQLKNKTLDTLKLSRTVLGGKVENHKLHTLAEYFGIKPPTHSARDDVMTTYEVYKKLISIK